MTARQHQKELAEVLDAAGLLSPEQVIEWARIVRAAEPKTLQLLAEQAAEIDRLRASVAPAPPVPALTCPLPAERPSITRRFDVAGTHGYLIIGMYPTGHAREGQPGELFLFVAKEGGTLRGVLDAWGRLFSVALQHGVPLADLVEKFEGCSFEPRGWTDDPSITPATSILDYVVRYLAQRFLGQPERVSRP